MTLTRFALAEASLAQDQPGDSGKKAPPKRTTVALSDQKAAPEPR